MNPVEIARFLSENSEVIPLFLILFLIMAFFVPIFRRLSRAAEASIESVGAQENWIRIIAFFLILHFLLSVLAVVACGLTTRLPAGLVREDLGSSEYVRSQIFILSIFAASFPIVGLLVRRVAIREFPPIRVFGDIFRPEMAVFGVISAIVIVSYSYVLNDQRDTVFVDWYEWCATGVCLYIRVPVTSVSFMVLGYIVSQAIVFLWGLAGKISKG